MKGYLIDLNGAEELFELHEFTLIGGNSDCHLQLKGADISERHARIELKDGQFLLKDMRSLSGTRINQVRINEAFLSQGDIITIGDNHYRFTLIKPKLHTWDLDSRNTAWKQQLIMLSKVARSEHPVLLLGPSGTGKEVLSEALHKASVRNLGPFIKVNCSALTESLVESELFGHIKGSFTGSVSDRKGAFEAARSGTLFLDEIGDLPYGIQSKLLRALENKEIRPVGSDRTVKTDVRIIAATHQNLQQKISSGEFRVDLFYRLNVIKVETPALADRMEDFDGLLNTFARHFRVRFSFSAIQKMKKYSWPGNIRELRNTVARASAFFPTIQIEDEHLDKIIDLDLGAQKRSEPWGQQPIIKEIERQMILKRLSANHGNQRQTATDLGMPKSTLHDRIRSYNIDPKNFR